MTPVHRASAAVEVHSFLVLEPWASLWVRGDVDFEEDADA